MKKMRGVELDVFSSLEEAITVIHICSSHSIPPRSQFQGGKIPHEESNSLELIPLTILYILEKAMD
jgi:hypothetical protein